ncbi:unnamed protein product [Periconia digitata]|uniref:Uncharacterized protein n=1 Tax=Periconia digitata TaxID=1303443 RepID=A0A9W4U4P6_9PLEO|nr:unnamed protein product [Periconia digitata]
MVRSHGGIRCRRSVSTARRPHAVGYLGLASRSCVYQIACVMVIQSIAVKIPP